MDALECRLAPALASRDYYSYTTAATSLFNRRTAAAPADPAPYRALASHAAALLAPPHAQAVQAAALARAAVAAAAKAQPWPVPPVDPNAPPPPNPLANSPLGMLFAGAPPPRPASLLHPPTLPAAPAAPAAPPALAEPVGEILELIDSAVLGPGNGGSSAVSDRGVGLADVAAALADAARWARHSVPAWDLARARALARLGDFRGARAAALATASASSPPAGVTEKLAAVYAEIVAQWAATGLRSEGDLFMTQAVLYLLADPDDATRRIPLDGVLRLATAVIERFAPALAAVAPLVGFCRLVVDLAEGAALGADRGGYTRDVAWRAADLLRERYGAELARDPRLGQLLRKAESKRLARPMPQGAAPEGGLGALMGSLMQGLGSRAAS